MMRWEYKVATLMSGFTRYVWSDDELKEMSVEDGLKRLGSEGWELVSSAPYTSAGTTGETLFVFKRPAG